MWQRRGCELLLHSSAVVLKHVVATLHSTEGTLYDTYGMLTALVQLSIYIADVCTSTYSIKQMVVLAGGSSVSTAGTAAVEWDVESIYSLVFLRTHVRTQLRTPAGTQLRPHHPLHLLIMPSQDLEVWISGSQDPGIPRSRGANWHF